MTVAARRSIDDTLAAARARLDRLTALEAYESVRHGAVLVDIRPESDRRTEGEILGAVVIERNVLEWRLDPSSDSRLRIAAYDLHVVVFCNEGYTSSLAAAALQDLGIHRATDIIGGFRAWRRAGLPITTGSAQRPDLRVANTGYDGARS
jgi:rhodanese-related sulfurtransferase